MKYWITTIFFLLNSCSTFHKTNPSISFSDVEQIQFGKMTRVELEKQFGKPTEVVTISTKVTGLIYDEDDGSGLVQRAGFNVDNNTNLVTGVLWIPSNNESLSHVDEAKKHFSNAHFIMRKHKQDDIHENVETVDLTDTRLGISLGIYTAKQRVDTISLGLPIESKRIPAVSSKTSL